MKKLILIITLFLFVFSLNAQSEVWATIETDPVTDDGDAADDIAIWIHPNDYSLSLVIGTVKKLYPDGIHVYNLDGEEIQRFNNTTYNNIDLRYNFPYGDENITIIAASGGDDFNIYLYTIDITNRNLINIPSATFLFGGEYWYGSELGLCMYVSPTTKKYYCFINDSYGYVEQWEIFYSDSSQNIRSDKVRSFYIGDSANVVNMSEGCVADDQYSNLYISEENFGIWKYGAEPNAGNNRVSVDNIYGYIEADVEGLALYYANDGLGYLIASNQGSSSFNVYDRTDTNDFIMQFVIVAQNSIDDVSHQDGIEITNVYLGNHFPDGLFISHDGDNTPENQNFKFVPWELIANASDTTLIIDTDWNPRMVGLALPPIIEPISDYEIVEDDFFSISISVLSFYNASIDYFALADTIDISVIINDTILTVTPSPNWFGTSVITVFVSDENNMADTTDFTLTRTPVNDSPEQFFVVYPTLQDTFSTHSDNDSLIAFTWNPSVDVDSDLTYTLTIELEFFGNTYTGVHENISDTTIGISSNSLDIILAGPEQDEAVLTYYVHAHDGEFTVESDTGEFVLTREALDVDERISVPETYTLHQNYPNPFNPITSLRYDLPVQAQVTLTIYDLMGREVTQLVNTTQKPGYRSVQWDATDMQGKPVSAGVYLYQIQYGEFVQTRKMVLLN